MHSHATARRRRAWLHAAGAFLAAAVPMLPLPASAEEPATGPAVPALVAAAQRAGLRVLGVRTLDNAVSQQLGARWAEQLVLEMLTADNAAPDLLGEWKKAEGRLSLNNRRAHPSD
jgi:hypothetical protein